MTFGSVGRIDDGLTDCTFMVVGRFPTGTFVRDEKTSYRIVVVLSGRAYVDGPIAPGEQGPIFTDDPSIEWLD
jgi:hypothetical protein